jgi:adenine deaminase
LSMGSDNVTTVTDDKVDSTLLDEGGIDQQRRQWFQSGIRD